MSWKPWSIKSDYNDATKSEGHPVPFPVCNRFRKISGLDCYFVFLLVLNVSLVDSFAESLLGELMWGAVCCQLPLL